MAACSTAFRRRAFSTAVFEATCQAAPSICGKYTLAGDKLDIHYADGKSENYTYKPLTGGMQLNYIIYSPVQKFPAGKINGSFSRASAMSAGSGSSTLSIVAPRTITFKPDGTFSESQLVGIDGAGQTSSSTSNTGGTYTVKDSTLTLNRNGKTETHLAFPVAGGNLNLDGQVYSKN